MCQKFPKLLFFILFYFGFNTFLNAQIDSLTKYSYEELEKKFYDTRFTDKDLCKLYAEKYLSKAKQDGDKVKISRGYYHILVFYNVVSKKDVTSIKYADSIIKTCMDCRDRDFPAMGYYSKGIQLCEMDNSSKALESLLKALEILKKNKNIGLEIDTRDAIISLRSKTTIDKETLRYQLELFDFIRKQENHKNEVSLEYNLAIKNLAMSFIYLGNYNKVLHIIENAISEKIETEKADNYYNLISFANTVKYYMAKYYYAVNDYKLKILPYLSKVDNRNINIGYFFLAKSYDKLNQPDKAHYYFLKTDSIYQVTKDIFPEMRNAYEHIIDYYKTKNDVQNQIKYYDLLIEVDKVIDSTYSYATETINKKFETLQAIAERNRLVEEARANESLWKYSFPAISAILLVILGVLVVAFRRQKYYKKRFESLMKVTSLKNKHTNIEKTSKLIESIKATEARKIQTKEIDLPEEIVETILQQLEKFETSQKFNKQISLSELAKKLGTNPKYLSKVINGHYQKNFSTYINELRIEYIISKLKEDSKFRNYTIKAIGKEAGFGNTESFSKAFSKMTGIKPSYFVKQLQKRLES